MKPAWRRMAAVVALLLVAGAIGGVVPATAQQTEIEVWYCWGGQEADFFEQTIQQFNDTHPEIKVKGVKESGRAEKIIAAITGGNPPDAVLMCNQAYIAQWAQQGAIQPLDDMIAAHEIDLSDVIPTSLQWVTYDGKLYGLPFLQDDFGLYWNKQLFREAGLDPEKPPTTIEELDQYAETLTKRDADGNLTQIGYVPDWPGTFFPMYAHAFGCQIYDEANRKLTANSPECVRMLEWNKSYYEKYGGESGNDLFDFVAGFGNYDSAQNPFFAGQVAMMYDGEWIPGPAYVQAYVPDMDYGSGPFPSVADRPELIGSTVLSGNPIFIPTGAEHPDEALEFMTWLMTPEPTKTMAIALSSVPQLASLISDPVFQEPHFKPFMDLAVGPNAFVEPMIPVWSLYADGYFTALQQVLHGEKTAQEALDELVNTVQPELDKIYQS